MCRRDPGAESGRSEPMATLDRWPWPHTLAATEMNQWVVVREILFGTVTRQCDRLGIRKGDVVRCVERLPNSLVLEDEQGGRKAINRVHAWFIGTDERTDSDVLPVPGDSMTEEHRTPRKGAMTG
jgi:hypothetical protein